MFGKTISWKLQAINSDSEWEEIVSAVVDSTISGKGNRSAEAKYERRLIASTDSRRKAERLIEILEEKFPYYEFAAHTDIDSPEWWRILGRTESETAISATKRKKIVAAANSILRNMDIKYGNDNQGIFSKFIRWLDS